MVPRRSDRELVEQMLNYVNGIKSVATEGELATALNINSETANKWLELFLLIKQNCPDFDYKKLGRYRIIDKIGLGGLAQELSQVELKRLNVTRIRATRYETLNAIHFDLRKIAKMLIYRLKHSSIDVWDPLIEDSNNVFSEVINVNVNQLSLPEGKDADFQTYKLSLKTCVENFINSIIDLKITDTIKPKLKLITLERDFKQKIFFITQKFEESELKAGRKPDYLQTEKAPISNRNNILAEMKVKLDDLPGSLQKPDMKDVERIQKRPKVSPYLKCFSCNIEQQFPIHCTQLMNYVDGHLVCEICKEIIPIPVCSSCNRHFGIGIKKIGR